MDDYEYGLSGIPDPEQYGARLLSSATRIPGMSRKKKPKFPPLPAEEEKSVLRQVMDSGIGGLQYIGETLDKPGRAVRGVLGGKPEELLNLIPFSDTMGITNPNDSVSGRDLLEKAGVLEKNKPGFADLNDAAGDVAGFGAEVLLDPTSYLTFGASAIGKAGKLAKAAGVPLKGAKRLRTLEEVVKESPHLMPALKEAASAQGVDLASVMGDKLGGAMGFTTGPLGLLGASGSHVPQFAQGERAAALLGGLDSLSAKVGNTAPARAAKMLFNHEVRGQYTPEGQMLGKAQTAATEAMRPKGLEPWLNLRTDLQGIHKAYEDAFGANVLPEDLADKFERLARMHAEGVASPEAFKFHDMPFHQPTADALAKATADFGGAKDDLWNQFLQLGGNSASMNEYENLKHSPRYLAGEGDKVVAKKSYKGTPDSAKARVEATKYIPADVINAMYRDPEIAEWTKEFSGLNREMGGIGGDDKTMFLSKMKDYLKSKYGKWIDDAAITRKMGPDGVAADLAEHFADRNKAVQFFTKSGQDLYGKFAPDTYKYVTEVSRKVADLSAIHETVGKSLVPGGVPLETLFKDAGMNPTAAMESFTKRFGPVAEGVGVAPEVANAVLSVTKKVERPEWLNFLNKQVDYVTQVFKKNVTQPFPSFLTRNVASGQAMNVLMSGEVRNFKDARKYGDAVVEAAGLMDKPEEKAKLINEMTAYRAFDAHNLHSMGAEIGSHNMGFGFSEVPNPMTRAGFKANITGGIAKAHDIAYKTQGELGQMLPGPLKKARQVMASPAEIGAQFNAQAEWMNRVPMYLYLRKHLGWAPDVAAAKVRQLQVDYSQLAPFEKDVMKRVAPFYAYIRKTVPVMLDQMAQHPGGGTAQIVRASNTGRSEGEFVPPYVGEGMSVKLGEDKYLSQLGLPTDQLSDLFVKGPTALGTIKRTGQKLLSMSSPYLKGPLEVATGQNFFTGRPIEESFPYPTSSVLANQVIHNSPLSRVVTTGRKLLDDDRKSNAVKALNALTGVQITDVSGGFDQQKRFAESKMLAEMLREHPGIGTVTDVYQKTDPKTGKPVELNPEAIKLLRAYGHVKKLSAEANKKRKKQMLASDG